MAAMSAMLFSFSGCNNEDEPQRISEKTADLHVETEISGMPETYAPLSTFPDGAKLGLFVTPGAIGQNYPIGPYNNALAEFKSGKWVLTPQVKLSDTPAIIYAYFPYTTSITNAASVPIYTSNQVDYMFGTNAEGQESVDRSNPNVRLRMKHALSLLQFKVKKMNYPGEGKLTRVEVLNAQSKYEIVSYGLLNIGSGEIAYQGQHNPAFVENANGLVTLTEEMPTKEENFVNLMILPVSKTSANGSVYLKFIIDGSTYYYYIPVNTTFKQGTKNTFNVTLNGTELTIDDIVITDWLTGPENSLNLY